MTQYNPTRSMVAAHHELTQTVSGESDSREASVGPQPGHHSPETPIADPSTPTDVDQPPAGATRPLAAPAGTTRSHARPPDIAHARLREQQRRHSVARNRALTALAAEHDREYRRLYAAESDRVARQRGPLPGDET